jgi:hypothetical protein
MRFRQPPPGSRPLTQALPVLAALGCIALAGCGGPGSPGGGPGTNSRPGASATAATAGPARTPAAASGGPAHLTGNLCADAARMTSGIGAITGAAAHPGGTPRRLVQLLTAAQADYNALASEAPGQLKGDFKTIASLFGSDAAKASRTGRVSLADVEVSVNPATAAAARHISSYFVTHCG